jgi:hypothetical protein
MWVSMLRCPRCGQQAGRRSPRAGAWDHLLSLVYLYPFRCQLCAARFRSLQRRRYARHTTDRREYDRLLVRVPVTLSGGTIQATGETADLSLNGCSIRAAAAVAPGATVRLRLALGESGAVEVAAAIVRSRTEERLGLQFVRLAPADHERLSRYLARFLRPSGQPGRRARALRLELVLAVLLGLAALGVVFLMIGRVAGPAIR